MAYETELKYVRVRQCQREVFRGWTHMCGTPIRCVTHKWTCTGKAEYNTTAQTQITSAY